MVKPFPKKWFALSIIAHALLFTVFYTVTVEKSRITDFFEIQLRALPEIPDTAPAVLTEKEVQIPEQHITAPVVTDRVTAAIDKPPDELRLPSIPPDFMRAKKTVDSTAIIFARNDSIFGEYIPVPYELDVVALRNVPVLPRQPTKEDTIRLMNTMIMEFLAGEMPMGINMDVRMKLAEKERNSQYLNDVLPVTALIAVGAKLAKMAVEKIFSSDDANKIDRFLDFDEIEVMLTLWKLKKAPPSLIYTSMPTDAAFTIKDILRIVRQLKEKKIVFEYQGEYENTYVPVISRLELTHYYEAVEINLTLDRGDGVMEQSGRINLDNLKKKIEMLTEEPFQD
ncbi:hypothetical protein ACFL6I_09765 [candidate division KSB1 bacterium]